MDGEQPDSQRSYNLAVALPAELKASPSPPFSIVHRPGADPSQLELQGSSIANMRGRTRMDIQSLKGERVDNHF